jgi:hypothetical protein
MSLLPYQIVIDIAFFATIVLLLYQLHRRIAKNKPAVDTAMVQELKKIMKESQESADRFLKVVEENEMALNQLVRRLDDKEKKLIILLEEAEALIKEMDANKVASRSVNSSERYEDLLKMIRQGLGREELINKSGFTETEINLVMELAKTGDGLP